MSAFKAGFSYFTIVFTAGFVFGTIRVSLLIPVTGTLIAVLIELPFMLATAWFACRWLVRWLAVPGNIGPRIAMGTTAFVMLMAAEFLLAYALSGFPPRGYAAQFATLPGLLGLTGQIAFAAFPVMQAEGRR